MDAKTKAMAVPLIAGLIIGILIGMALSGGVLGEGFKGMAKRLVTSFKSINTGPGSVQNEIPCITGLYCVSDGGCCPGETCSGEETQQDSTIKKYCKGGGSTKAPSSKTSGTYAR